MVQITTGLQVHAVERWLALDQSLIRNLSVSTLYYVWIQRRMWLY